MKNPKQNDPLTRALRKLPTRRASDDFTAQVMSRLDAPRPGHWKLAVAAAAVLALGAILIPMLGDRPPATDQRVEQLQLERSRLLDELEELQRARTSAQPVVYLGASPEYDLVLDLDPFLVGDDPPVVPSLADLRIRRPTAVPAARRQP